MAQAALGLLHDPDLWACYSDAARTWAASFSWDRCVSASLDLFDRVASAGSKA
jgi:glycosyltransferase involved in cell wall biosynthesis